MSWSNPNYILNEMIDNFQSSTHNLMKISRRSLQSYDKGIYGVVIARLSNRLESVFSVDREVIVIFSNFPQQQARTIRFARQIMADEDVRLEPSLAIVVHQDRNGNEKLRNWGRQNGMTVLPIHYINGIPADEELERLLCSELFGQDLFDITGPVSDDSQFYGRRTEAQELARNLQRGQIRSCLGLRKIGKTSIINRVIDQLRRHHDAISVMVDCSKDVISSLDASALIWSLSEAVRDAVDSNNTCVAVSPRKRHQPILRGCEELIDSIRRSDRTVIIFFDEVDYITPGSPNNAARWTTEFNVFWRNLRAVYQELSRSRAGALSLLISGVSSKWFSVHAIGDVENAALSLIPEEYLSPLPRGASNAMIRVMSRASGLTFDDRVRDQIADVAADIPFWIRKACSFIHRHVPIESRPYNVSLTEVNNLMRQFVDSEGAVLAQVALAHLFTVYPELEEGVFSVYGGNSSECAKPIMERLRKYGIASKASPGNALSGDMMQRGFELYLEDRTAAPVGTIVGATGDTLGDWADDLAVINRKRNVLEKKLRDLVLGFLRYDSLYSTDKAPVNDRILRVVRKDRRHEFERKSSDEIIENLMWSELTSLISREWVLFERVFSDRRRFQDDCNIINDRPDAHAKEIDAPTFALYMRSLDRLSDALASRT